MKTNILIAFFALFFGLTTAFGQAKYLTKSGHIAFYSDAKLEKIEAHNYKATAALTPAGAMEFSVLIKGFEFEKALMQEHFNENYMESDKYPKATFKGKVTNMSSVKLKEDGSYPVDVSGTLTIHGVAKSIKAKGTINVSGGKVSAKSTFNVAVADYGIKIEADKVSNIAKTIKIVVELSELKPM